jgi:hypothetical protein
MTRIFRNGLPSPKKRMRATMGSIVSCSLCGNVSDKAKKDIFGCLLVGFDMLMSSSYVSLSPGSLVVISLVKIQRS